MAKPRDTLKFVRRDISSIVTRLEAADKTTQQNVAALETALRSLAQQRHGSQHEGEARQKEIDLQIGALKTHLLGLIRDTQKAVNTDLKMALDDPRITTLATAIDQADNRLRQAEAEQAQNLDVLKKYVSELAREVDKNLSLERKSRQAALAATDARQTTLQQDIANCLKTIEFNSNALETTQAHLKTIENDTSMALKDMGNKISVFAEHAKDAREEQARTLKAKVSDIALESQQNFNDHRDQVDRNIESLKETHEIAKQELARGLDDLRTRLETLEYGFSPNSATPSKAGSALVEDAFTPHVSEIDLEPMPTHINHAENTEEPVIPFQEQRLDAPIPAAEATTTFTEGPIPFTESSANFSTAPAVANPYVTEPTGYNNVVDAFPNDHHQAQPLEVFDPNPYGQLNKVMPQNYEQHNAPAPYNSESSFDASETGAYETGSYDMPYANPAYAESNMTMEQSRPGTPVEMSKKAAKRGNIFTPSNLRAAVLGVAVLGVGYYAMGKIRGSSPTSNDLPENVFVESPLSAPTAANADGSAAITSSVQTLEPIGDYANDVNSSISQTADAKSLLETAANDGNPIAEYQLGLIKLQTGDTQEALSLLRASANKGQAVAQYRLAKLYETGTGVTRDLQTARTLIEKAAQNGNRIAMHDLANFHANGAGGVEQDLSLAAKWFEKAAERGVVDSQYNIGYLYEFGFGVTKNLVEAYVWYNIASAQGDTEANRRVAALNQTLSDVEINSAQTRVAGFKPVEIDEKANGVFEDMPWRAADAKTGNTQIADVQALLNNLGYSVGEADGTIGTKTRSAIIAFEKANGLPETGRVNASLVNQLELAAGV
ncbi:MAG: peptidoglycan-binding protein [Maricaulaceae bacterium]